MNVKGRGTSRNCCKLTMSKAQRVQSNARAKKHAGGLVTMTLSAPLQNYKRFGTVVWAAAGELSKELEQRL